jgi:hypothetical protein
VDEYITSHDQSLGEFAGLAGITERTLRNLRTTGRVSHKTLRKVAKQMGVAPEELLKSE